ncbi:transmembrane emp24 domain-containing protein 3 [Equus quagga]|uniref:transmembrane emp24 domain-containing protein 3 n=1 Tax=Equus quagga TaxID=89248 RepID=UPI001EE2BC09|nr:transmembrane emp24 domain-containing protein 3 [Equus quagga]
MPRRAWASVPGPPCSVRLRTESPALPEAQRAPRATSALAQPARSCSRRPSRGPWGSTGNIMDSAAPRSTAALLLLLLLLLLLRAERTRGAELTFELPDSAKQCFHEDVEQGVKFSLDYQVITGGHYDVDCYVEDPLGNTIYRETKKQYDSFTHRAEVKGVYQFCFSNEFSTFSHKTIYFDFQVGDEPPILPDMGNRVTALTQMESACVTIHEALKTVIDSQTHYRLREAQDRARAEDLNNRVSYWSIGETVALFVVSFSQVLLLKSFFTEKRPVSRAVHS